MNLFTSQKNRNSDGPITLTYGYKILQKGEKLVRECAHRILLISHDFKALF